MDWGALGRTVAKFAPVLGGALAGGPVGAGLAAVKVLASEFGADEDADALHSAIQADPEAAVRLAEIESSVKVELRRLQVEEVRLDVERESAQLAAETAQLAEQASTQRAELSSTDEYVRRWRPAFGYAVGRTWVAFVVGLVAVVAGVVWFRPAEAGTILTAMGTLISAMMPMWVFALSVLGISVRSRSHDKQVVAGQAPSTLFGTLAGALKRG